MLFGLALNCELKINFIEEIQNNLEISVQKDLHKYIELVTVNTCFAISKSFNITLDEILLNLNSVIQDRDSYLEFIIELKRENVRNIFSLML